MAIELTERAVEEIKSFFKQHDLPPETFLRVAIKGGGCAGFEYLLDTTDKPAEGDEVMECKGVKLVCDPKSYMYVNGMTIDWCDSMMGRGFRFSNPTATSTCGCGKSFCA
ncbi:MAG: iron-sulfur cluster assembly accessory protein [Phycisphaerae bacterium]|nr:iron-sulfur cluster assembly accessory protein [Phycisphaerae bacterium]